MVWSKDARDGGSDSAQRFDRPRSMKFDCPWIDQRGRRFEVLGFVSFVEASEKY